MRQILFACLMTASLLAGARVAHAADTVVIYRCVDAKGHVSLQDDPCPKDSSQSTRDMVRPQDAPAPPVAKQPPPPPGPSMPALDELPPPPPPPPPPLYRCTSYDGIVRETEVYDPNPHCEPLALYYPNANQLTPAQAGMCRWVQDSCVRLSDEATCAHWKLKRKEAESAYRQAFSDAAYRKSELIRIKQIIDESCP